MRYKNNGLTTGQKWTIGIVATLIIAVVGITVTGLCLGHTNPVEFVKSWFVK